MSKFSQKESVFAAVKAYCQENGIKHEDGQKLELSKDGRKAVIEMVTQAALAGTMELSVEATAKYSTAQAMRTYCNGLVSNWLRKDVRFNGGEKYTPANPGSRAGQGDEVIKNLRALKKNLTATGDIAAVDAEIEKRVAELKTSKVKAVTIDASKIPEHLRALLK